jgi:hypothetical protein
MPAVTNNSNGLVLEIDVPVLIQLSQNNQRFVHVIRLLRSYDATSSFTGKRGEWGKRGALRRVRYADRD